MMRSDKYDFASLFTISVLAEGIGNQIWGKLVASGRVSAGGSCPHKAVFDVMDIKSCNLVV